MSLATLARALVVRQLGRAKATAKVSPAAPGTARRFRIPDDWNGIRFQIGRMIPLVQRDIASPYVVELARAMVLRCPSRDFRCELGRIFESVKRNMRFVEDPRGRELIQAPERMAKRMLSGLAMKGQGKIPANAYLLSGDCDEHAAMTAALAAAVGYPVAFGFGGSGGRAVVSGRTVPTYHHVWGEAQLNGVWIPLDTTGGKGIGEVWSFQDRGRVRIV